MSSGTAELPSVRALAARRAAFASAGYGALGAVVAGPLLGAGLLLAVDSAPVPRPRLDPSYWGLGQGTHEGTLARLPLDAVLAAIGSITSVAIAQKLVLVLAIALAGLGMHRLTDARHPAARVFAGVLYAVNPFVYERIWTGQLFLILGYALLPWAFQAFRGLLRGERPSPWGFAALALVTAIASTHMAILLGLVCLSALFASIVGFRTSGFGLQRGHYLAIGGAALAAVASTWWLLPTPGLADLWNHIGRAQLALYASAGDPHVGLLPTLAALSGYWNDATPAISHVPAWPALALVIVVLTLGGLWLSRRDPIAWAVAAAGAAGFLLALGYAWSPTQSSFAWLLAEFPWLRSFRESGKGLALVAFAYAYLGSLAVDDLVRHAGRTRRARVAVAALLLAVPLTLGSRELWGAWGRLRPSQYPLAWASANRYLTGVAQRSRTLVLPFHGYFGLSFAHGRVVANPAAAYFQVPVVISRSVGGPEDQSDPEQARIDGLLASRRSRGDFAACLAALGIARVLVLHQADWQSYGSLATSPGMSLERTWPGVTLYRSARPTSLVMAHTGQGSGCGSWTPVPAARNGTFGVRLLADAPAGAALRVELANSRRWRRRGSHELTYTGWSVYRRNYLVGLALLAITFAWPLARAARAVAMRTRRRRLRELGPLRRPETGFTLKPAVPHLAHRSRMWWRGNRG